MRTCVTFSFKSGCQEVPLFPLYERGQLHGVVFLTVARKFWKFCQEERLGGNDKAFLYSSWEVPQWWVEIFKTYSTVLVQRPQTIASSGGWNVRSFCLDSGLKMVGECWDLADGGWLQVAMPDGIKFSTSPLQLTSSGVSTKRARALESLPKHIRKNTWSQTS